MRDAPVLRLPRLGADAGRDGCARVTIRDERSSIRAARNIREWHRHAVSAILEIRALKLVTLDETSGAGAAGISTSKRRAPDSSAMRTELACGESGASAPSRRCAPLRVADEHELRKGCALRGRCCGLEDAMGTAKRFTRPAPFQSLRRYVAARSPVRTA